MKERAMDRQEHELEGEFVADTSSGAPKDRVYYLDGNNTVTGAYVYVGGKEYPMAGIASAEAITKGGFLGKRHIVRLTFTSGEAKDVLKTAEQNRVLGIVEAIGQAVADRK
jgi:hypothetical protein